MMFLKIMKNIGIWGYIGFGVLGLLFVFGETIETPGNLNPYTAIAVSVIPLALMLILVFKRVSFLRLMFIVLSAVVVVLNLVTTFASDWWGEFRDANGPVLGVATLILSFVMAFWARIESRTAGLLIFLVTITPFISEAVIVGGVHWGGSTVALSFPGIIAGLLILLGSGDSK